MKRIGRRLFFGTAIGALVALFLGLALLGVASVQLDARFGLGGQLDQRDDPRWRVRLPQFAGVLVDVRAMPLLRAATSPLGMRLLDGRQIDTGHGEFRFARQDQSLNIACRRCDFRLPELAAQTLPLAEATLQLRRNGDHLSGSLHTAKLGIDFTASLADDALALQWTLPPTALADALASLRPLIPELARARLQGLVSARGTLALPQRQWRIEPVFEGLAVYGLGTEGLRFGAFSHLCRDASGALQRRTTGDGSADWLSLDQAGQWLPRAVIAAEDAAFYHHPGYDLSELQRAQNGVGSPELVRGASTLSQQLAKYLFTGAEPTLARKLRELLYVVEMERTLGKRRLLTLYLNTVDWGPGLCGAGAAARHYFAKPASELTLTQAAWLAGVLRHPQRAFDEEFLSGRAEPKRLRWVIKNMRLPAVQRRQASEKPGFVGAAGRP